MRLIYVVTCVVTEKQYVGQTANLRRRWQGHRSVSSGCRALREAIERHGEDSFTFQVLELVHPDVAASREEHWIRILNSLHPRGYNLKADCRTYSDETRARISQAHADGRCRPGMLGRRHSGATRARMRVSARARGANAHGERHGHAKLAEAQVRWVRSNGLSQQATADQLGVSRSLIGLIRQGKIWRNVA